MPQQELLTRGVAKMIPADLAKKKLESSTTLRLYWGIDPTGARIHLGHAVPLRTMQRFVEAGHEVIFLVGSFTAMIGDPSGRDTLREPLTREQVEANFQTYKEQASKVLDFSKVQIRYNHEWLDELKFREILALGSHFTVNQMIERDMFEKRLNDGKPIAVTEFLYPLMVGYDSVMLDVDVELGGTDQEFNMLAGRTLQKAFGKREKFVMTTKLLEGTDGRKMSKTYDNCVYLDDAPDDMFGKIMSVRDDLMPQYFELCTNVPMDEVKKILKGNPRDAKVRLAAEIVTLYHGSAAAEHALTQFETVFRKGGVPDEMPEATMKKGELLLDLLVRTKTIPSKSEGRRLIEQGGISLNDEKITSLDAPVSAGVVKVGKRKFLRIG